MGVVIISILLMLGGKFNTAKPFNVREHFGLVFDGLAYMLRMFLTSGASKTQPMENVLTQIQ